MLHALALLAVVTGLDSTERRLASSQIGQEIRGADDNAAGVVALSGTGQRLAIGASFFDGPKCAEPPCNPLVPPDKDHGRVRVFQLTGSEWLQIGDDIVGKPFEESGFAVALDEAGDTLAVGGWGPKCFGPGCVDENPGFVRVFEFKGDAWTQVGEDLVGEEAGDRFGSALALSDDGMIVAVGAPNAVSKSGAVRVFERTWASLLGMEGDSWKVRGGDVEGVAEDDRAGFALDLNKDGLVLAVGARFNDGNGKFSGHVRVFDYQLGESLWQQIGDDIDGGAPLDKSGRSVSLSEDGFRVAIGAIGARNDDSATAGHVRVFELKGDAWTQVGDDIDGLEEGDELGTSVALSADGNVVATGAPGSDSAGLVRVFAFDGAKNWYSLADVDSGASNGDRYGEIISLSHDGRTLAVGSLLARGGQGDVRAFSIDEPENETPEPSPKSTPPPSPGPEDTPEPSPMPSPEPAAAPTAAPSPPPQSDLGVRAAPAVALLAAAAGMLL